MTDKQERFVKEYMIDLNATQAAIRTGYSVKTAYSQGQRLLKDAEILASIQKAMKERGQRTQVTQDEVVEELAGIGLGRKEYPVFDMFGNEHMRKASVTSRIKALELLGKHLGMFTERLAVEVAESSWFKDG